MYFKTLYVIALIVSFSSLLGDCCAQATVESKPPQAVAHPARSKPALHRLTPPVRIVDYRAYGDGGTLGICLMDANNDELLFSVSQDGFEGIVPADTLFLNSWHLEDSKSRLPTSDEEVAIVLEALKAAVHASLADSDLKRLQGVKNIWSKIWDDLPSDGRVALSALRRLKKKPEHAILNREKKIIPEWYAAYDARRQKQLARRRKEAAIDARFNSYYPSQSLELFEELVDEGNFLIELPDDEEIKRGKLVAEMVGDPVELAVLSCKALGTIRGSWRTSYFRDRVAIEALRTVRVEDFVSALSKIEGNEEAMLGAGRILYAEQYGKRLSVLEWQRWMPPLTELLLTKGEDRNKAEIIESLTQHRSPDATTLLLCIARGDIGLEPDLANLYGEDPGLRCSAYLGLAETGEKSVLPEIKEILASVTVKQDRAGLEVSLALLGDSHYLKAEHFTVKSRIIGLAALRAIEQFEGRHGMDLLMLTALDHSNAYVANEALEVAQRITGQEWVPKESRIQPRMFADKAKAWWKTNGDGFKKSVRQK